MNRLGKSEVGGIQLRTVRNALTVLRALLPALIATILFSAGASVALAHHSAEGALGGEMGASGGLFAGASDAAVDHATGRIYVADKSNHRIQRFGSDGTFELAWGRGVAAPGSPGDMGGENERQEITVNGATGGTFILKLRPWFPEPQQSTVPIAYDAPAPDVQAALEALTYIDPGDVSVTGSPGGPYTVEFAGQYAATDIAELIADDTGLTEGGANVVVTVVAGSPNFEVCSVASQCRPGSDGREGSDPGGELDQPSRLAFDQGSGTLYVSDGNNRITEFDQDGGFERLWGAGVVQPGGVGDVPTNEIQRLRIRLDQPAPAGGTFALTFAPPGGPFETTEAIPYNASAAQVHAALVGLVAIDPADVSVTGPGTGPWEVEFSGAYANTDVSKLGVDDSKLLFEQNGKLFSGGGIEAEVIMEAGGFEICTVAAQCLIGRAGGGAGQLGGGPEPAAIAVGPTGKVFAADLLNARVNEYETDGSFVRAWGWGVDTDANAFEICTAVSTCEAGRWFDTKKDTVNAAVGQFATNDSDTGTGKAPHAIAVDPSGIVYATNADGQNCCGGLRGPRVDSFDSTAATPAALLGGTIRSTTPPNGATPGPLVGSAIDLEVDPTTGNLYYLGSDAIQEIDPDTSAEVDAHLVGGGPFGGFGYDSGTDRFFAASQSSDRVVVAGLTGSDPPLAAMDDVLITGPDSVLLSGLITPGGPAGVGTLYRFEYRRVGASSWAQKPSPDFNLGSGASPVVVEAALSELEAGVEYEARLVATKEFGAGQTITDPPHTFTLGELPPDVVTVHPQARTATTATLTGAVDNENVAARYWFEWGPTQSYGTRAPVPDGQLEPGEDRQTVTFEIEGLAPGTTYHYRVVADNGIEVDPGDTEVEGDDVQFTTRAATPPDEPRAFEMVTPPFKATRAVVTYEADLHFNQNPGYVSLDGETVLWESYFFPLTEDVGAPLASDSRVIKRTQNGWENETLVKLPLLPALGGGYFQRGEGTASSGDFGTLAWSTSGGISENGGFLPTEGPIMNRLYTIRQGTGVEGFTPWLTNPSLQAFPAGTASPNEHALLNDAGTAMARWGEYRGLAEDPDTAGDDDPSDEQLLTSEESRDGGSGTYLLRAAHPDLLPLAKKELIAECTGAAGGEPSSAETPTQLPARVGTGVASDVIGTRPCEKGTVTSVRGAGVGGSSGPVRNTMNGPAQGPAATALADTGNRVFFTSPDPSGASKAPQACSGATGPGTDCPPQLFVRTYDSDGQPVVRWISRSRSSAGAENTFGGSLIPNQRIAEMGAGTGFQGASRSGGVVYFKTNAPLIPTDPDGGSSVTGDSASNNSWDLYRYDMPADPDADPADGSLLRVSGGPSGNADPSTNCSSCPVASGPGSGAALRHLSDDGQLAYFVTTSPIAGADVTPPLGGSTTPGGAVGNSSSRNLYLFDGKASGQDRYRFIARIPFSAGGGGLSTCASYGTRLEPNFGSFGSQGAQIREGNCFRGTPDGSHVAFFTGGQLTGDDTDAAGDIYLYNADADELVRASAPGMEAKPYRCDNADKADCNADLGSGVRAFGTHIASPFDQTRGWAGNRYYNLSENPDGTVSLFFESRSELISEDVNGEHWDVYEWREGDLSLISDGSTEDDSWFSGNSTDGEDVFIATSQRIDPREIDSADFDIYDARRNGGFPYVPPAQPCNVLALRCESEAVSAGPMGRPVTPGFNGTGNVVGKPKQRCGKGKVKRKGRCVKSRKAAKRKGRSGKAGARRQQARGGHR